MPIARLQGVDLHYVQLKESDASGLSDDIVMVHGLAANLAFWYLKLAPAIAGAHRVTLFDLRGHGRSGMPPRGYSPAAMAGDLEALLDHCGIARAHLVAHSFGGLVALQFACLHPDRVRSLSLLDVRVPALQRGTGRMRRRQPRWRLAMERLGLKLDENSGDFGHRMLEEIARLHMRQPEVAERALIGLTPFVGRGAQRSAGHWLQLLERTTAREELARTEGLGVDSLARLQIPVLLQYGEHSQALGSAMALKELWPHARLEIVPNAGHFFPVSRPEVAVRAIQTFLPQAA